MKLTKCLRIFKKILEFGKIRELKNSMNGKKVHEFYFFLENLENVREIENNHEFVKRF